MESLYYIPSPECISSVDTAPWIKGRYYRADDVDKRIAELESELSDDRLDRAGLRAACEENQKMREVERLLHDTIADLRENNDRLCERIVELGARVYAYSLYLQAACKECDG